MSDFLYNLKTGITVVTIVAAIVGEITAIISIGTFLIQYYPRVGAGILLTAAGVFVCWGIGKLINS